MITRRSFAAVLAAAGVTSAMLPRTARALKALARPVVVELFTSQGCSSCPPADAYLGTLAARDDVIALAYHVDYWDYIGWKDPFGDATYTTRQRAYLQALGNRTLYTPQMIVDGEVAAVGSDSRAVNDLIRERLDDTPGGRESVQLEASLSHGELRVQIPDTGMPGPADVLAVAYDDLHTTEIPRGENSGVTLKNVNVVRAIRKIGEFHGPGRTLSVPAKPWTEVDGGIAILVQSADHGPIWGATKVLVG